MNSKAIPLLLHVSPGDPEPLREQIARQLRSRIARGELPAGEILPGHRQLARQYRIAPSTVEAAYELLVADGLVTGTPDGDVMVAELRPELRRDMVERLQLEKLVAQELGRRELEMARDVQRRLLPPSEVDGPGWEVAARCLPARVVAGDFYDILQRADGSVVGYNCRVDNQGEQLVVTPLETIVDAVHVNLKKERDVMIRFADRPMLFEKVADMQWLRNGS